MNKLRLPAAALLLTSATVVALWLAKAPTSLAQDANRRPVLVELFTSEGCSSCPPADNLLIELDKQQNIPGVEVVALGEHVDYWDGTGWLDRFSSHAATLRQEHYVSQLNLDSPYTPEAVVDGHFDVVGNNRQGVQRAILEAARAAKPATVTVKPASADSIQVDVEAAQTAKADVLLAITESDLSTHVSGGENGGRELHHTAVVRLLKKLGSISGGRFSSTTPIPYQRDWNRQHLRAVVFVQHGADPILGVAALALDEKR